MASVLEPRGLPKSAALLAAPGVLNPTAFFSALKYCMLKRRSVGNLIEFRPGPCLGLCWHYVGSFFALGRALDAFSASCCVLLPPLAGFDAFWGTPGSILTGSGTLRGGFWRSKGPIFRSFSMPLYALALQWRGCSDPYKTLAGVVQNTHRSVSAIERATQKTSKNRPNSFLDNVFC